MRLIFILLFFIASSEILTAQNYERVDAVVATYPSEFIETDELAAKISEDFQNPLEQVRAIYNWITQNVAYDWGELGQPTFSYSSEEEKIVKEAKYQKTTATRVLRKKVAICSGYSYLFKELCDQLGIRCEKISGYARNQVSDIAKRWKSNHAWNLVTIDGNRYLIDATWGAGHVDGQEFTREVTYKYFLTSPEDFIKNHYPEDYKHSLLKKKVSKKQFCIAPFLHDITEKKYLLVAPVNRGVLKANQEIEFSFKTAVPVSWVSYSIAGRSYDVEELQRLDNTLEFAIDLKGKRGRSIIIYLNGEPAVSYLIRN